MTQEQEEQVAKHFGELYSIAIGLTPNIPDDISEAMKMAYMAGADYAIDMFAMNWISVEDELPPEDMPCLIYDERDGVQYASYRCFGKDFKDQSEWGWHINVTHWQHLPQPPSSSEIPNNYKEGGEQ